MIWGFIASSASSVTPWSWAMSHSVSPATMVWTPSDTHDAGVGAGLGTGSATGFDGGEAEGGGEAGEVAGDAGVAVGPGIVIVVGPGEAGDDPAGVGLAGSAGARRKEDPEEEGRGTALRVHLSPPLVLRVGPPMRRLARAVGGGRSPSMKMATRR